ncbi:P-loop NTPase fold protein [Planococcus shixiaomingii]|uniref:P-loop NTPase fold protein n=1 Tax=Planococcus shixiaomingii TaxID=3058393 RepID=UPI0026052C49|nr:P-loop NTPase fold protein [Planococcus sp. N022]WKA54472.1 P-loop NTPase fold protein [Planococcus sp. N022]
MALESSDNYRVIIEKGQPVRYLIHTFSGPWLKWETGKEGSFQLDDNNPDGTPLDYSMLPSPEMAVFEPESRTFTWTPRRIHTGETKTFEFHVTSAGVAYKLQVLITIEEVRDNPTRQQHAQALTRFLMDKRLHSPLVIGIYNDWGEGRSAFLNLIETEINRANKNADTLYPRQFQRFHVVRFDASEYDDQEKIWLALLKQLFNKYQEQHGNKAKLAYWKYVLLTIVRERKITLLLALLLSALIFLAIRFVINLPVTVAPGTAVTGGVLASILLGLTPFVYAFITIVAFPAFKRTSILFIKPTYDELKTKIKYPNYRDRLGARVEVIESLNALINVWLSKTSDKVVVMVDHIDNCSEESIVEFFEALELFNTNTDYEQINFIIPMNPAPVRLALAAKNLYRLEVEQPGIRDKIALGHEILESCVTFPYTMPPITDHADTIHKFLPPYDSHWTDRDRMDIGEDAFLYDEQDKLVLTELLNTINVSYRPIKTAEVKRIVEFLLLAKEKWKTANELNRYDSVDLLEFRHEFISWFFLEYFFPDHAEHIITYLKLNKADLLNSSFMDLITIAYPIRPWEENFDLETLFVFLKDLPLNLTVQEYIQISHRISKSIVP